MDRLITVIITVCLSIAIICIWKLDIHCKVSYNVALMLTSITYMLLAIVACRGVIIC